MTEERMSLKQRRDLSQIIETAFTLYARNFWPLYSIAAVVIPLGIASAVLQVAIDDDLATAIVITSLSLLQVAVSVLAVAAIIAALGDIDAGRPAEFSHAYDVAFERFWTLLGALLRVVALVLLLFVTILGIPWAIQRSVRWLFVQQAVILDRTSARAALSYSADAVSGSWWRTFGIMILLTIIVQVPAQIISAPFALAPPLVSGTVSSALSALVLPLSAIGMTLLYFDLKARRQAVAAEL